MTGPPVPGSIKKIKEAIKKKRLSWKDINEHVKKVLYLKYAHGLSKVTPVELDHIVKPTDTLYSIARKYDVTIQDLMTWNDKKDFTLAVGEKLKIKRR